MVATSSDERSLRWLFVLASVSLCIYLAIAWLSSQFALETPGTQRPIVAVVLLFSLAFIAYLTAIPLAVKATQQRGLLTLIIGASILFRAVLLCSLPIQEVDIYRYLWDGAVSITGVNPFRFTPNDVLIASDGGTSDPDLKRLVELQDREVATSEILENVHFGQLPTVYPTVSQIVFASVAWVTPDGASVGFRVVLMKLCFVGFDLATLCLVIGLLRRSGKPLGLSLVYAWCPLLLKEVANSGHLDAIAVFLTTAAVYLTVSLLATPGNRRFVQLAKASGVALVLALAAGAKLYPLVLAPLLMAGLVKRIGFARSFFPATVFAGITLAMIWPMLPPVASPVVEPPPVEDDMPPQIGPGVTELARLPHGDPSRGVTTFLRQWEMNDFIFLILFENLRPASQTAPAQTPWFSVLPDAARADTIAIWASLTNTGVRHAPFMIARAVTTCLFLGIASWVIWQVTATMDTANWCRAAFLILAWFWLLCPTQNPWYWTWVLPLLPFAKNRAWLLMSGLVFFYYLRFWFAYKWPETPILGTPYVGIEFFDYVVTWIEYAPWFVWLGAESFGHGRSLVRQTAQVTATFDGVHR